MAIQTSKTSSRMWLALLVGALLAVVLSSIDQVHAGNKGNKGKGEDIILYNGNIVMRGDKKGGSIVLANQHPHNEEIEFMPSFFGHDFGHGHRRRR